jgi:hypothetical protein
MLYKNANFGSKVKAALTAETITFTASDIQSDDVVSYQIAMTGTDGTLANNATRIRMKASGSPIWDIDTAHYRAFTQRMYGNRLAVATTATSFTLPLFNLDDIGEAAYGRYNAGFPKGSAVTLELVTNATAAVGTVQCGWTANRRSPQFWTSYLGSQMNIAASTTNGRYPITQGGFIRGFSINTTGLTRVRLVLSGEEVVNLPVANFINAETPDSDTAATLSNPYFIVLDEPRAAALGTSFVEIDTGAGWAGVANELGLYAITPQRA